MVNFNGKLIYIYILYIDHDRSIASLLKIYGLTMEVSRRRSRMQLRAVSGDFRRRSLVRRRTTSRVQTKLHVPTSCNAAPNMTS